MTPFESVKSHTPVDFSVARTLGNQGGTSVLYNTTLGAEVRNLFDIDPPMLIWRRPATAAAAMTPPRPA